MKLSEELVLVRWNVLVVDAEASTGEAVERHLAGQSPDPRTRRVRVATSVEAAVLEMQRSPADVLFVNLQVGDNAGLELIRNFKRRWPRAQAIAVSRVRRGEVYLEAWRAGATDLLHGPLQPAEVGQALSNLVMRRAAADRLAQRNERLRTVCRRLNKARHEISQQVDLLCNDLVRAYQEMAQQLNLTQLASEYAQTVRNEIEIEGILRRTMEWVLRKLGPINAAVYLPNGEDHFALGAYLNLDTQADAPLIECLAQTVVEQARDGQLLSIETDHVLTEMFAEEAGPLLGRTWLALGCRTSRECLAVLVMFRKQTDPTSSACEATIRGIMEAIGPVLAERIEQALGFYHRLHPFQDEEDEGGQEMDLQ